MSGADKRWKRLAQERRSRGSQGFEELDTWTPPKPSEVMRRQNCKTANFQKGETYPSIRPPKSRCSRAQTIAWLADSIEADGCERRHDMSNDDILKMWHQSPHKNTLGYYGVESREPQPEAALFNRQVRKSLAMANSRERRRKQLGGVQGPRTLPSVGTPKTASSAAACRPFVLNREAIRTEIEKMPTVKRKLSPNHAITTVYCNKPPDPGDPFGVSQEQQQQQPEVAKEQAPQRKKRAPRRRNFPYCGWAINQPQSECTEYERQKNKHDKQLNEACDEAFQREQEPEPRNYDELFSRLVTCFETLPLEDPLCKDYAECCLPKRREDDAPGAPGATDDQGDGGAPQPGDRYRPGDKPKGGHRPGYGDRPPGDAGKPEDGEKTGDGDKPGRTPWDGGKKRDGGGPGDGGKPGDGGGKPGDGGGKPGDGGGKPGDGGGKPGDGGGKPGGGGGKPGDGGGKPGGGGGKPGDGGGKPGGGGGKPGDGGGKPGGGPGPGGKPGVGFGDKGKCDPNDPNCVPECDPNDPNCGKKPKKPKCDPNDPKCAEECDPNDPECVPKKKGKKEKHPKGKLVPERPSEEPEKPTKPPKRPTEADPEPAPEEETGSVSDMPKKPDEKKEKEKDTRPPEDPDAPKKPEKEKPVKRPKEPIEKLPKRPMEKEPDPKPKPKLEPECDPNDPDCGHKKPECDPNDPTCVPVCDPNDPNCDPKRPVCPPNDPLCSVFEDPGYPGEVPPLAPGAEEPPGPPDSQQPGMEDHGPPGGDGDEGGGPPEPPQEEGKPEKEKCPPCPCEMCEFLRRHKQPDTPMMRKLKRQDKLRQLREYYKRMCHRQYMECRAPEYRAPQHRCDPIVSDNAFCRNPQFGEYCECLKAMQDLQQLLGKKHKIVGNQLLFDLEDLKSRLCKRMCDCI
ncbi:collagen alpha-1(XVI) chain-like [Drosophila obscura]|uniref:collagen alpha-1(XVI) chain-like n=1 Tax=Drosophila obscura TaxID=7282 RepID=UPI001BB18B1C|nr:collagen alpha-1(XVI) chain-like [Drosophila obscura]